MSKEGGRADSSLYILLKPCSSLFPLIKTSVKKLHDLPVKQSVNWKAVIFMYLRKTTLVQYVILFKNNILKAIYYTRFAIFICKKNSLSTHLFSHPVNYFRSLCSFYLKTIHNVEVVSEEGVGSDQKRNVYHGF